MLVYLFVSYNFRNGTVYHLVSTMFRYIRNRLVDKTTIKSCGHPGTVVKTCLAVLPYTFQELNRATATEDITNDESLRTHPPRLKGATFGMTEAWILS